jgi:SAM-dependent methyltransferase
MKKYLKIVQHYENCLERHGDTHLGVDWPNVTDLVRRYEVMLGVIKNKNRVNRVLDFGCGLGGLVEHINERNFKFIDYLGLDISNKYIEICKRKYPTLDFECIDILEETAIPFTNIDYIVMNGVFTEKRELSYEEMFQYFKDVLVKIFPHCNSGVAFNLMSKHVDWERSDLFHVGFDELIEFVQTHLSRNFIIRNDYGLYEYAVYIYQNKG